MDKPSAQVIIGKRKKEKQLGVRDLALADLLFRQPYFLPPLLLQAILKLPNKRFSSNPIHKFAAGNNEHTLLAAGEHDIGSS